MPWPQRCGPGGIWCWIWGCCPEPFEEIFEPLGPTALAIQALTGLWMGWIYLPRFQGLLNPANPIGMLVSVKLLLLAATAALAVHVRLRDQRGGQPVGGPAVIPGLSRSGSTITASLLVGGQA